MCFRSKGTEPRVSAGAEAEPQDHHARYSLWRGSTHLADLVGRFPAGEEEGIAGILRPTPSFGDLVPLVQSRQGLAPGQPVIHAPIPSPPAGDPVPLRRLPPDLTKGLSREQQLILRGTDRGEIDVDVLMLRAEPVPVEPGPLRDLCVEHGITDQMWVLIARFSGEETE